MYCVFRQGRSKKTTYIDAEEVKNSRVTGAFTDIDKQLVGEHILKHNKNNWSIHFE